MNRIKKWSEQDSQRIRFIKIGLVLLGIILLIAFPCSLSSFEWSWYLVFCKESTRYSKKKEI